MARIRSIKPEFPQSESVGRLSRDARLLFIQLWTLVDDSGRARAASRMLASLLYPYDDDAPKAIDQWLTELEAAKLVRLYEVDGSRYLDIPNWLKHQKIDKPSKSRLPEFDEASRGLDEASRTLAPDLGPRTLDLGKDQEEEPAVAGSSPPESLYAFESGVIRLTKKDFEKWKQVFSHLDVPAELVGMTDWANTQPRWFNAVSGLLAKRNREIGLRVEQRKGDPDFKWKSGIEGVV